MKLFHGLVITFSFILIPSLSSACSFCSSKPKGLTYNSPTQDPGAQPLSPSTGFGITAPSQTMNSRGSAGSFTYDLKNYKPDGQRSTNEKWNSGDFFDNR